MPSGNAARIFALVIALVCVTRVAHAQTDTLGYSAATPTWVGHFTTLSANAALGAVTGGLFQKLRGGSFKDGFARGALGGAVIYAGKRVAAERFFGAGLLGREVAAVGASVVRNASDNVASFDRLFLPVGPARIYWQRKQGSVAVKADIIALGFIAYGIAEDELHFSFRESLSGGVAVFETENKVITHSVDAKHAAGAVRGTTVYRANVPGWGNEFLERALAHERVHVLQDDQLFVTLIDHADDWAFKKAGARQIGRFVDVNVSLELLRLLTDIIPRHADRPWEMEAIFFTR